jgi:hypothetical protein
MFDTNHKLPRVTITNIDTGFGIEVQANPVQYTEISAADYQDDTVPGMSHQPSQFRNSRNFAVNFELHYMVTGINAMATSQRARRFLHSLQVPIGVGDDIDTAGTPKVLLVWPGQLSLVTKFRQVSMTHQRFNRLARSVEWRAQCNIVEHRDRRMTSQEVFDDEEYRLGGEAVDLAKEL